MGKKQFNPVGHHPDKEDILTTNDVSVNGMRMIFQITRYTDNKIPNYWLMHPIDWERVKRDMYFGPSFGDIQNMTHYEGIKVIQSTDLQPGQIHLI